MDYRKAEEACAVDIPVSEAKSGDILDVDIADASGDVGFRAGRVIDEADILMMKRCGIESITVKGAGLADSPAPVVYGVQQAAELEGILIVDDAPIVRKIIRRVLENGGYNVIGEAEDGDDAVLMARKLRPKLVTMDILMNRLDGINALKAIKYEFPETKVIIITSNIKPSVLLQCIKAGAENFVHKPFDDDHILSVVKKAFAN